MTPSRGNHMEGIKNPNRPPEREGFGKMKHALRIRVSRDRENGGVVTCRQKTVRERMLRFLLGSPTRLTVIVPGDTVDEVGIQEVADARDGPEGKEEMT